MFSFMALSIDSGGRYLPACHVHARVRSSEASGGQNAFVRSGSYNSEIKDSYSLSALSGSEIEPPALEFALCGLRKMYIIDRGGDSR